MAARRTEMHQLQELIRLHRLGRSGRKIARQLRMSRDTVGQYQTAFRAAGLLEGCPDELPEPAALADVVAQHVERKPPAPCQRSSVSPWAEKITALRERGVGPTAIHDWLRLHEPEYSGNLSSVKRICARLGREQGPAPEDVAIPVVTAPGEVAQVDFGYVGKRYDPERGELRKSWVFVMTLGFSRHMFCEIVFDQKISTWIDLHVAAFEFFGGVPAVIVPDNLKAAVIRAAFGVDDDPVIQRTYRELARAYGFQIDPAPPRQPQKKGKVESDVGYVKGNFCAAWESVDIHEDRRQLRRWLLTIAARRRHGTTGRAPIELFEKDERKALIPLPKRRWKTVLWRAARLHRDAHIQVDGAFYSAPWRLLNEELWVRCTEHEIAIHHRDEHLVTHSRVARGQRQTLDHHLPEGRSDLRHRSREHWLTRARRIGEEVEDLATAIFDSDDVLLQLRKVQAVVTHLERFPASRARATCRRALFFGCLDYAAIKNILRKGLDLVPLPETTTRDWSKGSRFARTPDLPLSDKEPFHGNHR